MRTFLLLASFILFHYPVGLYKNTEYKYKRLKYYNSHHIYYIENNIHPDSLIKSSRTFLIAMFASMILALLPLFSLLKFHWIWIVIINTSYSIFIAGISESIRSNKIMYSRFDLRVLTFTFLTIGILIYLIQYFIYA